MNSPKPTVDLGYPTEAQGDVPSFASIEEEAEFWDTHDLTDFGTDFNRSKNILAERSSDHLTLHLDRNDQHELAKLAEKRGVGTATLALIWLKERIGQEAAAESD